MFGNLLPELSSEDALHQSRVMQYTRSAPPAPLGSMMTPPSSRPVSPSFSSQLSTFANSMDSTSQALENLKFNDLFTIAPQDFRLEELLTPPSSPPATVPSSAMELPFSLDMDFSSVPEQTGFNTILTELLTPSASPYASDSEMLVPVHRVQPVVPAPIDALPFQTFNRPAPVAIAPPTETPKRRRARKRPSSASEDSDEEYIPVESTHRRKRGRSAGRNSRRMPVYSKRDSHNISERQRRKELKVSFEALRAAVPVMEDNPRVHTGTILSNAIEFIRKLEEEDRTISTELAALREENARLKGLQSA